MARQLDEKPFNEKWEYEFVDRISRVILVFYAVGDNNAKGSIVLDTKEDKEQWTEFLKKLGFSMRI